ncbi:MAG TPA: hypothetical protein VEL47_06805 [Myxococcota bacterium]|nr:hypothetical protein [Myxococcota bacterium]
MTKMHRFLVMCFLLGTAFTARGYRIEEGAYYVGGGFGVNVNTARFDKEPRRSPGVQLPLIAHLDYAIDRDFGVFGDFIPQFAASSLALGFKGGAKYWFSFLDTPYVPYAALSLTTSFLFPSGKAPNHVNLGFSPGFGMNYFVLAKFLLGAHVHFNPSIAFADGEKKFEFSVLAYFDVTIKI